MPSLNSVIHGMLMMLDITWMGEMLMDAALLSNLPRVCHVDLEVFESMWVEAQLQDLAGASIVELMVIGHVIVKLGTGRISVTVVVRGVTLRGTVKTVLRSKAVDVAGVTLGLL